MTLKIYKELAHIHECPVIHCNYCQNDRTLQFLPRSQTSQIQPIRATQREGKQQSESLTVCCGLLHGWEKVLWVRPVTVLGKDVSGSVEDCWSSLHELSNEFESNYCKKIKHTVLVPQIGKSWNFITPLRKHSSCLCLPSARI